MRFSSRLAAVLALVVAGAAIAVGCGKTVLDTSKIEGEVQGYLERELPKRLTAGAPGKKLQRELGISTHEKISSVDCPPEPEVDPGKTFSCSIAFANGQKATEIFRIVNDNADVEPIAFGPSDSGH